MFSQIFRFSSRNLVLKPHSAIISVRATSTDQLTQIEERKAKLLAALEEDLPQPKVYPERDLVNFPKLPRPIEPGKVRMGFIPDEWFLFFYKKTGVTGPYVFGAGLLTFLFSKEIYVVEDEFSTGIALFILCYTAIKKFGPPIRAFFEKEQQKHLDEMEQMKADGIKEDEDGIEESKRLAFEAGIRIPLIAAKRENVHMQLEAEYRSRAMHAYQQVKKRLDYMLDIDSTRRQFEQKYMVDWVISNVMKSITPQQEKEALQKCVTDLKMLSARSA